GLLGNGVDRLAHDQVDHLGQRGVEVVRGHDRNTVLKGQRLDVLLELPDVVEEVEVALAWSIARLERPNREVAAVELVVVDCHHHRHDNRLTFELLPVEEAGHDVSALDDEVGGLLDGSTAEYNAADHAGRDLDAETHHPIGDYPEDVGHR